MNTAIQFPYVLRDSSIGDASLAPMLPIKLMGRADVSALGLVDSGAAINVMPYRLGVDLGFIWEHQTQSVALSGNMASTEARVLVLSGGVGPFPEVRLAFAWAKIDSVPLILGQVNFFMEFDICLFRSRRTFEIRPKH